MIEHFINIIKWQQSDQNYQHFINLINMWFIVSQIISILSTLSMCDILSSKYINFIKFINVWYIVQQINQFYQIYQCVIYLQTNKSILSNLSICDLLSDKYINFIKFINVWYIVQQNKSILSTLSIYHRLSLFTNNDGIYPWLM